jgi:putative sugar O-methyltransferase
MVYKYKFDQNFTNRYKLFLNFNLKTIKNSPYWEEHKKKINVKISKNYIKLSGDSGFYHNKKKSFFLYFKLFRIFFFKFKLIIDYFFNNLIMHLSYGRAFNVIFSGNTLADIDLNRYRINFTKVRNNSNIKNFSDLKKDYKSLHNLEVTDHVVKSYYWFILLKYFKAFSKEKKKKTILEIGAGTGHLASLIYKKQKTKIIIIDLFETLTHSIPYIKSINKESSILFPNEITKKKISSIDFDFIFLLPNQIHLLSKNTIDLVINTLSFQEMLSSEIKNYFKKIYQVLKNRGFFFSVNRVEKIAASKFNSKNYNILPNRFFNYPFVVHNSKIIVFEICRLMRLVQLDNVYIRLEKIIKNNKKN